MKPVIAAVAVLSSLVVGTLTYQHYPSSLSSNSNSQEALRDALKEGIFIFKVGDKVITKAGWVGYVNGILPIDTLKYSVKKEHQLKLYEYLASELARTEGPCVVNNGYKFCIGDWVRARAGHLGQIKGVFPNGDLAVLLFYLKKMDNYSSNDLAVQNPESCSIGSGYKFCVGDKVSTKKRNGLVVGVFPDGALCIFEKGSYWEGYRPYSPSKLAPAY